MSNLAREPDICALCLSAGLAGRSVRNLLISCAIDGPFWKGAERPGPCCEESMIPLSAVTAPNGLQDDTYRTKAWQLYLCLRKLEVWPTFSRARRVSDTAP